LVGEALGRFSRAADLYLLARLLVGGASSYLLARLLRLSRPAAGLTAVSFMLMPQITLRTQMGDTTGAVWYPAALAAAEYLLQRPGGRAAAALGLVLAASLYSFSECGAFAGMAVCLYLTAGGVARRREAVGRYAARVVGAAA